ncbi:MAG: hypothetical protein WC682_05175 [Parcubacteria group bacterium]|jgi:hypothetical protein
MSLHVDPMVTLESLRRGLFSQKEAQREINDLIVEISSGIHTLEQLGLKSETELKRLQYQSKRKRLLN